MDVSSAMQFVQHLKKGWNAKADEIYKNVNQSFYSFKGKYNAVCFITELLSLLNKYGM